MNALNCLVTSHRIIFSNHPDLAAARPADKQYVYFVVKYKFLVDVTKKVTP